ncbi:MAG: hypothetical protein LBP87_11180 [Planctomycetaceae bacterium]|nr:hypothetical protein [Planctomycetaceae bacterium]
MFLCLNGNNINRGRPFKRMVAYLMIANSKGRQCWLSPTIGRRVLADSDPTIVVPDQPLRP